MKKLQQAYDYIVVGAGSAGCIITGRLAAETSSSVLLIERGPAAAENPDTMSADGFKYCFANDNVMLDRFSIKQSAMADRIVYQGTGSTMGGSGSVNGMVYTRGDKDDFNAWPAGWQWDDNEAAFSAVEAQLKPQSRAASVFTQAAIDAAVNCGFKHKDDLNDGDLSGFIGHNSMNYQGDRRSSSYMAYIHEKDLPNLTVLTHCITHKVLFDDMHAVGVELEVNGCLRQHVSANKEVILSAGALETPKLLMLSGVGPASELRKFNIPCVLEQEAIGKNLHDHPNVCMFYKGKKKLDFGYPQLYAFFRANKNLAGLSERQADTCLAFFAAPITLRQSMYRMAAAVALPQKLYEMKIFRTLFRVLIDIAFVIPAVINMVDRLYGIVVILGKPESRGQLGLASNNAADQAVIDCAYYQSEADMQTMLDGIAVAQKLAADSKLQAWGASPISAGGHTKNTEKLKRFVHGATMTTFHFCGSCKMGDETDAPVDKQLKLKGITGLRIADASVIPVVPVSAINAPSMMIAYKVVDFILQNK